MFSDPFTLNRRYSALTVDAAGDIVLAASERAADHSSYRAVDVDLNDHLLFIGHQYGSRRNRFTARYTISGFTPSLLAPDQNSTFTQSVYVVADVPPSGPVQNTSTLSNIFRNQLKGIGSFLVIAGAATVDPLFARAITSGET